MRNAGRIAAGILDRGHGRETVGCGHMGEMQFLALMNRTRMIDSIALRAPILTLEGR